jgi:AcrR family transcriptional regulator
VSTAVPRSRRADAQRNRDAILGAARALFDADGIFAPIDRIAVSAGVGNATLYRNFPTRNDLLAAVIEDTFSDLLNESDELETTLPPDAALREWLHRLAWQLRIWNDLPTCIAIAIDDSASPVEDVVTRLTKRTRSLLERAHDDGTASGSVTADELVQLITSVSWGIDRFGDDRQRARRRVDLAIAGVFDNR